MYMELPCDSTESLNMVIPMEPYVKTTFAVELTILRERNKLSAY